MSSDLVLFERAGSAGNYPFEPRKEVERPESESSLMRSRSIWTRSPTISPAPWRF